MLGLIFLFLDKRLNIKKYLVLLTFFMYLFIYSSIDEIFQLVPLSMNDFPGTQYSPTNI